MSAIRINPEQVRLAGVAAVACGDDLRAHGSLVGSAALPAMPAAMAARHQSALSAAAVRLAALGIEYGVAGEELQVRAAAAELADAPGEARAAAAGRRLVSAVEPAETRAAVAAAAPPDPHGTAQERPAASRSVAAGEVAGGPPAAAVQQAVAAPVSTSAGGESAVHAAAVDPADMPAGEHRAEHAGLAPAEAPAPADTDRQDWACWMASAAAREGLPPELPVMMALAGSGLRNLPGGEHEVGFFGLDPGSATAPPGSGLPRGAHPDGDWWAAHPGAQLDHVLRRLGSAGGGARDAGLEDPEGLGRWASEAAPQMDAAQFADAHAAAGELVGNCRGGGDGGGASSGGPLSIAQGQLGVHEAGTNAGPEVNRYLASAGVSSGNPWCAGFVTWSLAEAGHEMPGGGWAAVSTWVGAAEAGQHGLQIVDAASARPGDIVAYDWGGGGDFGADGHIGFLESSVEGGRFTTVEGNSQDAVTRMERSLGGGGDVVFIRMAA